MATEFIQAYTELMWKKAQIRIGMQALYHALMTVLLSV
jgi:hypothetical protein